MTEFLEYVVKGLVEHPDAVRVSPIEDTGTTLYELRVHPGDVGKVIGRQGATIHAIRALLQVGAAKKGVRCSMELVEDEQEPARKE